MALSERAASTSQTKGPEENVVGQVTATRRERPPLGGRPEARPRFQRAEQPRRRSAGFAVPRSSARPLRGRSRQIEGAPFLDTAASGAPSDPAPLPLLPAASFFGRRVNWRH